MFPFCVSLPGKSKSLINPLFLAHIPVGPVTDSRSLSLHRVWLEATLSPQDALSPTSLSTSWILPGGPSWVFFLWLCSLSWDGSYGRCALFGWVRFSSFRTLCSSVLTWSGLSRVSHPLTFPPGTRLSSPRQVFAWCSNPSAWYPVSWHMQEADINLTCSFGFGSAQFSLESGKTTWVKPVLWSELGFLLPAGSPVAFLGLGRFHRGPRCTDPVPRTQGVVSEYLHLQKAERKAWVGNDAVH